MGAKVRGPKLGDDVPPLSRRFDQRIVFITGATQGIGLAAARAFKAAGATVIGAGRDQGRLLALSQEIDLALTLDVAAQGSVDMAVTATLDRFSRIDVLVNNAGVGLFADEAETEEAALRALLEVNLLGAIRVAHAVLPGMRERRSGVVMNVASVAGLRGYARHSAYCASKHALVGWTAAARRELLGSGVHVGALCPPAVDTGFFDHAGYPAFRADHPGLRLLSVDTVALALLDAVEARAPLRVVGPRAQLLHHIDHLAPGLIDRILRLRAGRPSAG